MRIIALSTLALGMTVMTVVPAAAQMRVDARIHASSGSCSQCDLSNKRLNGMTLKNADFSGSIFNNSNLSGGQVHGSDLTDAHFRKALLYGLEGDQVTMTRAVMEDATLTNANLSNSKMAEINLHRADLSRGHFRGNDLRASNLINATAPGVDFTGSNFEGARLDHVNLQGAKLGSSNFKGARFGNAILLDADLTEANLSGADLSQAQGLKQDQLDQACGSMTTKLPYGLSVPYCEGILTAEVEHDHKELHPEMAAAMERLDRAMRDVEVILNATPRSNRPLRRKLESIHTDIAKTKAVIER